MYIRDTASGGVVAGWVTWSRMAAARCGEGGGAPADEGADTAGAGDAPPQLPGEPPASPPALRSRPLASAPRRRRHSTDAFQEQHRNRLCAFSLSFF